MADNLVKSRLTKKQAENVSYWDEVKSSFAADRDADLRERAEANIKAKEAAASEEERKRREGVKARRDAGY